MNVPLLIVASVEGSENVTVCNEEQLLNALAPILVTETGIVIDVNPELKNAKSLIVASAEGSENVTVANKEQFTNVS